MTLSATENTWYVLHTKSKQEERAARNLAAWNVETFVPRIASHELPHRVEMLFPGYVFAYFDVHRLLHKILFTRGVARVVSFSGKPAAVGDDVIQAIRARTNENGVASSSRPFNRGDVVVIRSGALRNLVGIFEREMPDHERVQILLTTVAYTARAEIARSEVSPFMEANPRKAL